VSADREDAERVYGGKVDFGLTADDYGRFRQGFPPELVERLAERGVVGAETRALDLGTGTGTLARLLAMRASSVVGTDPSEQMLEEARAIGGPDGLRFAAGSAEEIGFEDGALDLVTAGQCWHWFDRPRAAAEVRRVLADGGRLVIAHFDWIPLPGNVVAATEELIVGHNPDWNMYGGTGMHPLWLADVAEAGFTGIETFSFDLDVPYSHEAWVGRIRASNGVGASLDPDQVQRFSDDLTRLLAERFPADPLAVPHRTWAVVATRPPR
jgi:SAM-dependent methyltransferase